MIRQWLYRGRHHMPRMSYYRWTVAAITARVHPPKPLIRLWDNEMRYIGTATPTFYGTVDTPTGGPAGRTLTTFELVEPWHGKATASI